MAILDHLSKFIWDYHLVIKDEAYDYIAMSLEEEIKALRGRDQRDYEVVLMSDLGEAHSKNNISACKKYGVHKTSTAGYTPQHNAFVERWFRTNSEMSRCQILQFDMEEEYWESSRRHATFIYNRIPSTSGSTGELIKTPFQLQYPDRVTLDLSRLQPFGITCWVPIKKARRPGKSDALEHGKKGILVGYDECQGPLLLAKIYFPDLRIFEFHDNAYIKYQNIQVELETQRKAAEGTAEEVRERPLKFYLPLIGTRHIDPYNGLLYETIDVKATKQRDIVAWRRRILNGRFQGKIQGPLHIHDIHQYTNQQLIKCAQEIQKLSRVPVGAPSRVSTRQETSCPVTASKEMRTLVGTSYPNHTASSLKGTDPPNKDRLKRLLLSKNDTNEPPERGSDETPHKKVRYHVLAEDANI